MWRNVIPGQCEAWNTALLLRTRPQAVCFCRDSLNCPCTYVNIEDEDTQTRSTLTETFFTPRLSLRSFKTLKPRVASWACLKWVNRKVLNNHLLRYTCIKNHKSTLASIQMFLSTPRQHRTSLASWTHSSSCQSVPWIPWSLRSTGISSSRLFSGGGSSWESACASIFQSSSLPAREADARPAGPALPPTPGHVWVSLWLAVGNKKRKSPHHTCPWTAEFCSQPVYNFKSPREKNRNGMPPEPSMTDKINCEAVLRMLMNITLMVLSPVSGNYKLDGDLVALVGRSDLRWADPPAWSSSCRQQSWKGQSDIQMLLTDSQRPLVGTHRSQRNHGTFQCHKIFSKSVLLKVIWWVFFLTTGTLRIKTKSVKIWFNSTTK